MPTKINVLMKRLLFLLTFAFSIPCLGVGPDERLNCDGWLGVLVGSDAGPLSVDQPVVRLGSVSLRFELPIPASSLVDFQVNESGEPQVALLQTGEPSFQIYSSRDDVRTVKSPDDIAFQSLGLAKNSVDGHSMVVLGDNNGRIHTYDLDEGLFLGDAISIDGVDANGLRTQVMRNASGAQFVATGPSQGSRVRIMPVGRAFPSQEIQASNRYEGVSSHMTPQGQHLLGVQSEGAFEIYNLSAHLGPAVYSERIPRHESAPLNQWFVDRTGRSGVAIQRDNSVQIIYPLEGTSKSYSNVPEGVALILPGGEALIVVGRHSVKRLNLTATGWELDAEQAVNRDLASQPQLFTVGGSAFLVDVEVNSDRSRRWLTIRDLDHLHAVQEFDITSEHETLARIGAAGTGPAQGALFVQTSTRVLVLDLFR